ncbi:MAG: hypothetical protein HQL60_00220 [Magnetococcales bacterium]|nr:hypothetical protein [Magnetococcales bacterium]
MIIFRLGFILLNDNNNYTGIKIIMNIVGLHFGHDGAVCVLKNGQMSAYISREREGREKHAWAFTTNELNLALSRSDLTVRDIDFFAITSTQGMALSLGLIENFDIKLKSHARHSMFKNPLYDLDMNVESLLSKDDWTKGKVKTMGWLDRYGIASCWSPRGATIKEIAAVNCSSLLKTESIRYGFHYPVTVEISGREIPGCFIDHHVAHAASSFFLSGFEQAAIVTHDGIGSEDVSKLHELPYNSGMIYYGYKNYIIPLQPHYLFLGSLYTLISLGVGLATQRDLISGSGKLMGLAPYGRPVFFRNEFVGNAYDYERKFGNRDMTHVWRSHMEGMLSALKYPMNMLAKPEHMTESTNADVAASTQKLFEECLLEVVKATHSMLLNSGILEGSLCLSGGTALNCPANTRIHKETPFSSIFITPACSDDGLAIGAAAYLCHQLLGYPRQLQPESFSPYTGKTYSDKEIFLAIQEFGSSIVAKNVGYNAAEEAANDLACNRVIAWFEGGSEIGPRALGHRSILANPTYSENWKRVNLIKSREWWRPFAPSVLEEDMADWFDGIPNHSPYMLYTARVKSRRLPAITHVDGTARVQTVTPSSGRFYDLICEFKKRTGVPVILNTSFNGPGEPIVETPQQAIAFLVKSTLLDALYVGEYRLTRCSD